MLCLDPCVRGLGHVWGPAAAGLQEQLMTECTRLAEAMTKAQHCCGAPTAVRATALGLSKVLQQTQNHLLGNVPPQFFSE